MWFKLRDSMVPADDCSMIWFYLGAKGECVKLIQQGVGAPITGIFDDVTDLAVKHFQEANKLSTDGKQMRITYFN